MEEFSASGTFPKLAKGVPAEFQPAITALVLNLLQPICDRTGWTDVINSGYRSQELNAAVGGVPASQHTRGEAADNTFKRNGVPVAIIEVLKAVKASGLDFDQMIAYPTFVHLSYTTKRPNRRQILYNSKYKGKRL